MAGVAYNYGKHHFLRGDIAPLTDTVKVALLTSAYTPDIDTDQFFDDIDANEVVGTGYTAGGMTLASKDISLVAASDWSRLDGADIVWTASTITARYWVIYIAGATPGVDDFLIGYESMVTDKSSTNGDFTITWDASGIVILG